MVRKKLKPTIPRAHSNGGEEQQEEEEEEEVVEPQVISPRPRLLLGPAKTAVVQGRTT
jgi:hypothetical protein